MHTWDPDPADGYSRLVWLKLCPRQTLATVIAGLEEAFAFFGGVPREVLFDQTKAVIVDDQRAHGAANCSRIPSSSASRAARDFESVRGVGSAR